METQNHNHKRASYLFLESIVSNLRYNACIRSANLLNSRGLEAYLRVALRDNDSSLIVQNTDSVVVSNVRRYGGGLINDVYSFLLRYSEGNEEQRLPLVIKTYRQNIDPFLKSILHDRDLRTCVREYEALRSLERVGFLVPKAYLCECDSRFLGYPFVIMSEVETSPKKCDDYLDRFALYLAGLHNLKIDSLKLDVLVPPRDGYAFARRWPFLFRNALNIETKHSARLKRVFDLAIRWLELNASDNFCSRYSLIHGDAHAGNALLTDDSRIAFIDWSYVDIGDPAFDVGNAYNQIMFLNNPRDPDSSEHIAERFLSVYLRNFKGDLRSRLKFYQVVSLMASAISYSSIFSSPVKAYKRLRRRLLPSIPFLRLPIILSAFPFLRWSLVARQIQADRELYWLKYFEKFVEKL